MTKTNCKATEIKSVAMHVHCNWWSELHKIVFFIIRSGGSIMFVASVIAKTGPDSTESSY